jgi:hypothetical protein
MRYGAAVEPHRDEIVVGQTVSSSSVLWERQGGKIAGRVVNS